MKGKTRRSSNGRKAGNGTASIVQKELGRWHRFAVRRINAGKSLRDFETNIIPSNLKQAIGEELAKAKTVGDVRNIFDTVQRVVDDLNSTPPADMNKTSHSDSENQDTPKPIPEPTDAVLPLSESERGPGGEVGEAEVMAAA